MFLIRTAFWLAVLVFLIPVDEDVAGRPAPLSTAAPVDAVEAMGAAEAALRDVGGFCGRNPDVCEVGGRLAETFALKARTGAAMAYRFFDEQLGGDGALPPAPDVPASGDPAAGTLTPADLAPAWNGPAATDA